MGEFLLRRTVASLVLIMVVASLVFVLTQVLPGDVARLILGGEVVQQEAVDALRAELGLDRPVVEQYVRWMGNLFRGSLGTSLYTKRPVSLDLLLRLPRTLALLIPAVGLAVIVGVPLGVVAALRSRSPLDFLITGFAVTGFSVPVFVTGTLLILIFSLSLGWIPAGGFVDFRDNLADFSYRAILPVATLSLSPLAIIMRITRSSVLEVLQEDYMRTARSKGVKEIRVIYKHALRNAFIPVLTVVFLQMGTLFGSTVIVEHIFNWPGMSSLLILAVTRRDFPLLQGVILVIAVIAILMNLIADICYGLLDPRVRYD